jgi:hypothetical protein
VRRLHRWLFNGLCVLSLLMCFATATVWVRCSSRFYTSQVIPLTDGPARWEIVCTKGKFVVWKSRGISPTVRPTTLPKGTVWVGVSQATPYAQVSYWELTAFFATLPAFWSVLTLRRRCHQRESASIPCPICGYDLRATPERCPECGAVPEKAAEPA